jgi:cyclopropane fatty-acyl-phospholipid synthase-like methyltransferase
VEIPIVNEYIKQSTADKVLEVGNVLPHYFKYGHTVIDKFEKAKGVINVDAIDYKPSTRFDRIISISTIEHIGWDDHPRDDKKIPVAIDVLKNLLAAGGKLIVTAPMGYNPNLDNMIRSGILNFTEQFFLKRINAYGEWEEIEMTDTTGAEYGKPFPCANVLFVGIYEN